MAKLLIGTFVAVSAVLAFAGLAVFGAGAGALVLAVL